MKKLAVEIPASVVFFDLLCENDQSLCDTPFAERRDRLERLLAGAEPPLHLTPATRDRTTAADWFKRLRGRVSTALSRNPRMEHTSRISELCSR